MSAGLLSIFIIAIFIENFVLNQILGICPFVGVSNRLDSAVGMGLAVTFVMVLAGVVTWMIQHFFLAPFQLEYLQTLSFILVIASLVQFVEMVIRKTVPTLYQALGVYLPLITTNCAVLGVALLNVRKGYGLVESAVNSLGGGLGFFFALLLMAGIRERLEVADVPVAMRGAPITFITAGLLAIAFYGFAGLA
ncbi:MAG: Electron transport complex protein RnfA [Candidatus Ozemobacter sibiricus]|jgi:electron transport complex protein RnfA|uniref:Ion-translocating oxidoreductase complex subunit A n=1 Tax=Candidatus Ozemobacter sibiricus TaxID=2268124 RepID=A0A367ZJD3_9BACT|nr:MAG: Electron transport complex protein RnfA [Candidatus Ozemobacter sibiricus]